MLAFVVVQNDEITPITEELWHEAYPSAFIALLGLNNDKSEFQ